MSDPDDRRIGLTLVAWYGDKPKGLRAFVTEAQDNLARALGSAFEPYETGQVHATIIGLEGWRSGDRIINANYAQLRQQQRAMDIDAVLGIVGPASDFLPMKICFGGFCENDTYPFTSRARHPFERSFTIQGETAVAMGWPTKDEHYPQTLDRLRRAFNHANVLHRYHASPTDIDNDVFLVLGRIDRVLAPARSIERAEAAMRASLSKQPPLIVELGREQLSIVAYADTRLPRQGSRVYCLTNDGLSARVIVRP